MQIRPERPADHAAVRAVALAAFDTATEADLIDRLRAEARPCVSLVAEADGALVGHVLFTPVTLVGHDHLRVMALAPLAVAPAHQRRGMGSALVRAGLEACRERGYGAVTLVGHPEYYPRFGFAPTERYGITCTFEAPAEAVMIVELREGYLRGASGSLRYHTAFDDLP